MSDEVILHLTEEQLTFFADRERAVGYREGHMAALSQRTWVGLTDEEVSKLVDDEDWYNDPHGFARVIEAASRSKNT